MTFRLTTVQVIDSMGRGGAEQALATLLPALRGEQVDCVVAVCREPFDLAPPLQADGFAVERLGLRSRASLALSAARLARLIQRANAQVVHAHLFNAELVTAAAGLLPPWRCPLRVVTFHNLAYEMHPPVRLKQRLHRALERGIVKGAFDLRLAVSVASSKHYAQHLQIEPPGVVPVAIPDRLFSYSPSIPASAEPPVIFMPARMSKEKGHFVMLDAARILADRAVEFSLVMAGHGPMRGNVQHRLEHLGLERHAKVLPSMSNQEVIDFMRRSQVVAMPSLSEGLGMAAIEAMALGVPIVASRAGGLTEVVEDNVTGMTVPIGDAPAFADAIQTLLCDMDRWREVARSARETASRRYAASSVARTLAERYRSALATK